MVLQLDYYIQYGHCLDCNGINI
uniref:Uncharacterized protein n=1 Tax=Anguilla anguilla TaxID=7936 RepID=A0A0E9PBR5_ANGAN